MIDSDYSEAVGEALAAMELSEYPIGELGMKQARFKDDEEMDDAELDGYFDQLAVAAYEWRSTPSFPDNVSASGALSGYSLLVAAVHAVLVDSGLARLDFDTGELLREFQLPGFQNPPRMDCFLRYTLAHMTGLKLNSAVVKVYKFNSHFTAAYRRFDDPLSAVKLDVSRGWQYAVKIAMALRLRGGRVDDDVFLNVLRQGDVFEFYKEVKDKLAMPILIELREVAGLPLPPCLMQLPVELKLRVLELVRGADLAKLACVCRELRDVTSDDLLWKIKYVQEFGDAGGNDSNCWKHMFVRSSLKIENDRIENSSVR